MTDISFGPFRLKRTDRLLSGPDGAVDLSARAFDLLVALLDHPTEVVRKDALFAAVWPGVVVEENTLQVHISALRKVLGAGMIMTVHGRGYRYAGPKPVAVLAQQDGQAPAGVADDKLRPMLDLTGSKKVPVTGGCLCGEIRYRIAEAALDTCFCHCRMCQKFSGSPFTVGSTYASDAVIFTKGAPRYYASSPFAERGFCPTCGASLTYRPRTPAVSPDWDGWTLVYTGSLDNPVPNVPTWHLGVESQMPWLDLGQTQLRVRCQDSPDIVEAWAAFDLPVP